MFAHVVGAEPGELVHDRDGHRREQHHHGAEPEPGDLPSGLDTVDAIRAMRDGRAKVFIGMGGNFAMPSCA